MPESQRPAQTVNKRVRFTSNVLRTVGVLNDALCLFIGYFVSIGIYRWSAGQLFDHTIHETAAIVLGINFFPILDVLHNAIRRTVDGLSRAAIAPHIHRHRTIARVCDRLHLVAPGIPGFREAVAHQDQWPGFPRNHEMDALVVLENRA